MSIPTNLWLLQTVQKMKLEFKESLLQGECSEFEILKNQSMIQDEVNKRIENVLLQIVNTNL